jgi:hypothetical protein
MSVEQGERLEGGQVSVLSAELNGLLRAAAHIHGLDEVASASVATTGMIVFDGMPVMAVTLTAASGVPPDNDLALVCPLTQTTREMSPEELAELLMLNFALLIATSCAVARSPDGALQLLHCARTRDFDAARFARKQRSMAAMAASIGPELARMAQVGSSHVDPNQT